MKYIFIRQLKRCKIRNIKFWILSTLQTLLTEMRKVTFYACELRSIIFSVTELSLYSDIIEERLNLSITILLEEGV